MKLKGFSRFSAVAVCCPKAERKRSWPNWPTKACIPADARSLAEAFVRRKILTAWQAEMLLQGKHRGFHLGPYVILQTFGKGSDGQRVSRTARR